MLRRTKVYTIKGFLNNEEPIRIEGGIPKGVEDFALSLGRGVAVTIILSSAVHTFVPMLGVTAYAATSHATPVVSNAFDSQIWPLFLDVGKPVAKTMIALGIYKVMRNDDRGWKNVQRAGFGLICLYLIDGAVHILTNVGKGLQIA